MLRLITRHTNRKLYDPTARRYVSLADIADLVIGGDSVRVIEHPSGVDATPRILAQAMVDLVKRRAQALPVGLMETLVRLTGGSKVLVTAEGSTAIKGLAERARKEAETIATRLVTRGRLGIEEALHLRKEVEEAIHRGVQAAENASRKPIDALRPGQAVRTIAGLARELKALETMVTKPPSHRALSPPAPKKAQAHRRKSTHKSRS
ncbi:MAG: hypothetical protein JJE39_01845 [Vicinamibacteria bacterium]|nr:hypothetical protein [Vicinamibacteria bacterium]